MMVFLLTLLWLAFSVVFASPAEEPKDNTIPILESTRELLGVSINRVANRLDMFFADQRADDELARSLIRVRQRYEVRERAEFSKETQLRFNIRLPHLEEKFRFDFKSYKDKVTGAANTNSNGTKDPNQVKTTWQFRADVGVNAAVPPLFFSRGRLRNSWQKGAFVHRFVNELAWYSDRAWEDFLTLDSDHSINQHLLFRFRNSIDWRISKQTFDTGHGPSLIQQLSDNDALSYSANASTSIVNGVWFLANYRLSTTYRRNIYKQWLYLDLTPGLDFPKLWAFRRTPFVFLQLEALFGGN